MAAGKLNDFNGPCVKWRPKTVLNSPIFETVLRRSGPLPIDADIEAPSPNSRDMPKADFMVRAPAQQLALSYSITNSRLGQNDTRVVGVFFDFLPELADIDAQILRILGMRRSPDSG